MRVLGAQSEKRNHREYRNAWHLLCVWRKVCDVHRFFLVKFLFTACVEVFRGLFSCIKLNKLETMQPWLLTALWLCYRQAFSFELSTTKQSGRSYLLAAENESSRQEWVTAFAKVMLSSQSSSAPDKLADLDAGGKIFIRDGTSCVCCCYRLPVFVKQFVVS